MSHEKVVYIKIVTPQKISPHYILHVSPPVNPDLHVMYESYICIRRREGPKKITKLNTSTTKNQKFKSNNK